MTDTTTNAPAEAAGALTTDGAIAALAAGRAEQPAEAAPEQAAPATETPSGDQSETTTDGAETPAVVEQAEGEEPAAPVVQPPQYWSKEAKERFAALPPELQAVVAEQEGGREKATGRAKQEAAEARKAAERDAGAYRERVARLGELVPQLEEAVSGKWAEWKKASPDDLAAAADADPAAFTKLKAAFDADMAKLASAKEELTKADVDAHNEHLKALVTDLPTVAPDLADPVEGPKRLQAVFAHLLQDRGITQDELKWVKAGHLGLAYDAMLYRQGKAALKAALKPEPKPAAPALRPAAASSPNPQAPVTAAKQRLARTGSVDDAVSVLQASRKQG